MKRLFKAAAIDDEQWKALTWTALKLDFRQSAVAQPQAQFSGGNRSVAALIMQLVIYGLFGLFMAFFVWVGTDLLLVGTLLSTYVLFIVGTAVLLDHNSALTSPADYQILGSRPVSSRTYFAVRLANVLVYTTAITTAAIWPAAGALVLRHGLLGAGAGLVTLYGSSLFAALVILLGYASVLRFFRASTIRRGLSYLQLLISFLVYGGFFVVMRSVSRDAIASFALPDTPWLWLYPGVWFGSWVVLAARGADAPALLGAGLSAAALAGLAMSLGGRLSLDYSARLAAVTAASERARPTRSRRFSDLWFRAGEGRAVAVLVRSQFRNDQRFRLSVLSIVPLTLFYVLMGIQDGDLGDPFASPEKGLSMVTLAIMIFPPMVNASIGRSDSFRASWIFFACPTDRIRVIRSTRNVLLAFFLLPYLLFVTLVYSYFVPSLWHVVVHMSLMGLVSALVLQVQIFVTPELPFSKPPVKGERSGFLFFFMFAIFGVVIVLQLLSSVIYRSAVATSGTFAILIAAWVAVDWLTRARVARQAQTLEFAG